jgi:protein TonB
LKVIELEITSDGTGAITDVKVIKSTGNEKFDAYVVKQTYGAKFKPYMENGIAYPIKTEHLTLLKINAFAS